MLAESLQQKPQLLSNSYDQDQFSNFQQICVNSKATTTLETTEIFDSDKNTCSFSRPPQPN